MLTLANSLGYTYTGGALPAPLFSVNFDQEGTDDKMTFTETTFDTDGNITFAFWFKANAVPADSDYHGVFGRGFNFQAFIRIGNDGSITIESNTNHDTAQTSTAGWPKDTNWHHYAFTIASGTVIIYVDGVSKAGVMTSNSLEDDTTLNQLGQVGTQASSKLDGKLYQVAIWSGTLAANEVSSIYNSGTPIALEEDSGDYSSSSSLIHHWKFDEGSGTSCADSAGSLTGTLTDDASFSSDIPGS